MRVNDGYFRNQLFPRDVARYATKDDIAKAAEVSVTLHLTLYPIPACVILRLLNNDSRSGWC